MSHTISLDQLQIGVQGKVASLDTSDSIGHRLLDLGFTTDALVTCVGTSPLGDPKAYLIRGAVIALRNEDARRIKIAFPKGAAL